MNDFYFPQELYKHYNSNPLRVISKAMRSFLRSKVYRDAKRFLKIKHVQYWYCHQKSEETLACYVMGTKKEPMIVLYDKAIFHVSKHFGKKREKDLLYVTMLHEMAHAYLDIKGLNRQSEVVVSKFSIAAYENGVQESMSILNEYLKKRRK